MAAAAAAGAEEEVEDEHEQEQERFVDVADELAVPLPLPDARVDALSGKATREEENESDMATRGSRAPALVFDLR